jgi:N-acyl-D-aspartate/D-glutamate deacylase
MSVFIAMPRTKKLLIRGGQVYDHDGDVHHPPVADILVADGRIAAVGANLAIDGEHEIIDARGRLVVGMNRFIPPHTVSEATPRKLKHIKYNNINIFFDRPVLNL